MADGNLPAISHEGVAAQVRRLQNEARGLARQHVDEMVRLMIKLEATCIEVSTGGDAYPAGVRDMAKRLAEEMEHKAQAIEAVMGRVR